MKKIIVLTLITMVIFSMVLSGQIMQDIKNNKVIKKNKIIKLANFRDNGLLPDPPEYNFSIPPVDLGGTVYDYMPGSYNSLPIRVQPGFPDTNGIYIVYHRQVGSSFKRKVNYSYIDNTGTITGSSEISNDNIREGFPGMAIEPTTGDPFVAYHLDADGDNVMDDNLSFDPYGMSGMPGIWISDIYTVINNTTLQNLGILDSGDEMIWPYVEIGPSPIEGKSRIYISANNYKSSTGDQNLPSENVIIAYTDVNNTDINGMTPSIWDWHYRKVQKFDDWHNENPIFGRAQKAFLVKDNYVVYIGTVYLEGDQQRMFALVNDNYGEGEFTYYEFDYETAWDNVDDIQMPNGNWLIGGESEAQGVKWSAWASWNAHFNAMFRDDITIVFPGALQLVFYDPENEQDAYYPGMEMIYPKLFTFNLQTGEFGLEDVYPADSTPDNMPILPWDLNEDGEIDETDEEGNILYVHSFPMFNIEADKAFQDCGFRITQNKERGWEAIVWNDASEAYLQALGENEYDDWTKTPKIMISVKNSEINTWSTPIVIDAKENDDNYNENIQGMIPIYIYPADFIESVNDTLGRIHLFFLNDDSYDSEPNPDNCRLEYAAIDAEFEYPVLSSEANEIAPNSPQFAAYNYPNPFNPTTTIAFNSTSNKPVKIDIYNLKGRKVNTYQVAVPKKGKNKVIWDGLDSGGHPVASGIYFYKIKQGKFTSTKKMILMK